MATTESMFSDRSDFDYDYETLRTTGVILAVAMFVSGILIALSHLVPKTQRQKFRLKLYNEELLEKVSSQGRRWRIHMASLLVAHFCINHFCIGSGVLNEVLRGMYVQVHDFLM